MDRFTGGLRAAAQASPDRGSRSQRVQPLDRGTMPPGYTVADTELALEVRPGESSLAEFPLITEARTIKMLPPLKLK